MNLSSQAELENRPVIIYGTGRLGDSVYRLLRRFGISPLCFADGFVADGRKTLKGVRVLAPKEAIGLALEMGALIIVASSYYSEIRPLLAGGGLQEGEDFVEAIDFAIEEDFNENATRLGAFRNVHFGRRAFLIGNGPSLAAEDLDRLTNEICYAANKIYLSYDQVEWRPSYYCVCDPQVSLINEARIRETDTVKFLANSTCFYGERFEKGFVLPYYFRNRTPESESPRFSVDPANGIYDGGSVIYMMMQLAFFMGVREIYLLGVDHCFEIPEQSNEKLLKGGPNNHFHAEYRSAEEKWTRPDFDYMNRAFAYAAEFLEERGTRVFNASRRSALEVFPRASLEKVLR